jgi:hypothetical protein
MQRRPDEPGFEYREPETRASLHRPPGKPQPREIKSQQAQLNSKHRHGTNKAVKVGMSKKTGLRKGTDLNRTNKTGSGRKPDPVFDFCVP